MTTRVHILSDGFVSPNARAFAFPLIRHRGALAKEGISLRFFSAGTKALTECDLLIVDSKHFHGPQRGQPDYVLSRLETWRSRRDALLWFDTTDSAGWIFDGALAAAKGYYKNQILKDRGHYLQPMYGRRLPSDFYHRKAGVNDAQPDETPQVRDADLLDRLHVSWNSGLADYSQYGPRRMALYGRLRWNALLRWPKRFNDPETSRPVEVSCRFGTGYERATVAHQRREIRRRLADRLATDKLARGPYMHELAASKIVISPFGLGEITLKDFEVFLSGAALMKPDMSHMETWPDLYEDGQTIITFRWDLEDLESKIEEFVAQADRACEIAHSGQTRYRQYVNDDTGQTLFCRRFAGIVERELA